MAKPDHSILKNKMPVVLPGILFFVAFACIYLFYELNRVSRNRRANRREELSQRRQELLDNAIKAKKIPPETTKE